MNKLKYEERKLTVLNTFGEFPLRIVFYLNRKDDKTYDISFHKIKTKTKIENIKLSKLKLFSFSGVFYTPLEVHDFNNYKDLDKKLNELSEMWVN